MNNSAMAGLNTDLDNFFDFEAASTNNLGASTHNILAQDMQTVLDEEAIHMMPLTKSEKEAILALRASNAQNHHQDYRLAPLELHTTTNFSGFEEPGAFGASLNCDSASIPLPTNFDDLDVPDYCSTQLNALDGFRTFAQPHFDEPAEVVMACSDRGPSAADQSG
jgi:hypothetical protein